jgi:hypothetical protein
MVVIWGPNHKEHSSNEGRRMPHKRHVANTTETIRVASSALECLS